MRWIRFLSLLVCLLLPLFSSQAAGLFQKEKTGPVILIGEVQSYGDYELNAGALNSLADALSKELREQKLQVLSRTQVTNENGRHQVDASSEDAALSAIHMDAIVRGHHFDYGYAAARLKRYADAALGRARFYDEESLKAWQKNKAPYRISPQLQEKAAAIATKYGADYLLFVNEKSVDVRLKGTVFASKTERETRGKKMKAHVDYYLLNPQNGLVYDGQYDNKKSAQMLNFALFKTGKGMNVDEMLQAVLHEQSEDMAKDLRKKGMKAVTINED